MNRQVFAKCTQKYFLALALLLALLLPAAALAAAPEVDARGATLIDFETGRILYAKNAHSKLPMASTTKIMTALIAIERLPLHTMITTPKAAYGIEGSSIYLNLGEKMSLEDLLYGLMLSSGNDAAVSIAVAIGGSIEGFAQIMNARAKELGANNTNFITPNGLHDEMHYTTAYDLSLISRAAMRHSEFEKIVSTQYWRTTTGDVTRTFKNKNKLLFQYEGANGIKTGFTKAAGRCLAFSARRNGHMIIGAVLNSPDMWGSSKAIMDYGFEAYRFSEIVRAGGAKQQIEVKNGMQNSLEIVAKEDILIPLRQDEDISAVQLQFDYPRSVEAPIYAGQPLGTVEAYIDGRMVKSVPLIAQDTVYKKEFPYFLWRVIRGFIGA